MKEDIQILKELAKKSGKLLLDSSAVQTKNKTGKRDLVTSKDVEIQLMLMRELTSRFPGCSFLCEEDVQEEGINSVYEVGDGICFIIDPIDGTANFVHGIGHSCTSIAMTKDRVTVAAVIYDPYRDEMFHAEKGKGSFLNGRKLPVYDASCDETISVFGTAPYDDSTNRPTFDLAHLLYEISADVRRTGSAALDLCWTAAGRFGLYAELSLSPWDYAAGRLIAQETGCIVTDIDGNELDFTGKPSILCGRPSAVRRFTSLYERS